MVVTKFSLLLILIVLLSACTPVLPPQLTSVEVAAEVENVFFLENKIFMEVVSFSEDEIELRVINNSEHSIHFTYPVYHRYWSMEEIFAIDYFTGERWMEIIPIPYIWDYGIFLSVSGPAIRPGEDVIVNGMLELHPIPQTEWGLYRVRLDILMHISITELNELKAYYNYTGAVRETSWCAQSSIYFYPTEPYWRNLIHTLVAEFYWSCE